MVGGPRTCDVALVDRDAIGLYYLRNGGDEASWFDVAAMVFDRAGMLHLLTPCASADYPTLAARPRYSTLDTSRLSADHALWLPPWRGSLSEFLETLAAAAARVAPRSQDLKR